MPTSRPRRCPQCHAALGSDTSVDGLCARCLLGLGLDPGTEGGRAPDQAATRRDRAVPVPAEYRVLTLLGRGPHGTVFLGEEEGGARLVAVKFIEIPDLAPRDDVEAIIGALETLRHPAIVPVLATGLTGSSQAYLVTEYLPAASLARRLTRAPLSVAAHLALFADLADALQHAHDRGLAHGHVVASNAFVGHAGGARLGDFGCAAIAGRPGSAAADLDGLLQLILAHLPEPARAAVTARLSVLAARSAGQLAATLRRWGADPAFPA